MTDFTTHTEESAPEGSREALSAARETLGFVPNILAVMAEAPAALKGYQALAGIFEQTSFTPTERQVVLMTASRENGCTYCMAAHTTIAEGQDVPREVIEPLREGSLIRDAKLEALAKFTRAVVTRRGAVEFAETQAFLGAGYERQHVLEVILGVTLKTLTNHTNHVASTELDDEFAAKAWAPPAAEQVSEMTA